MIVLQILMVPCVVLLLLIGISVIGATDITPTRYVNQDHEYSANADKYRDPDNSSPLYRSKSG